MRKRSCGVWFGSVFEGRWSEKILSNVADNEKASGVKMGYNNLTANVSCLSMQLCNVFYCFQPLFKRLQNKCVKIQAEEESFCRYTGKK